MEGVPTAGTKLTDQEATNAGDTHDALAVTLGHSVAPLAADIAAAALPAHDVAVPTDAPLPRPSGPRPPSEQLMDATALVDVPRVPTTLVRPGHPTLNATTARTFGPVGHAVLAKVPLPVAAAIVAALRTQAVLLTAPGAPVEAVPTKAPHLSPLPAAASAPAALAALGPSEVGPATNASAVAVAPHAPGRVAAVARRLAVLA